MKPVSSPGTSGGFTPGISLITFGFVFIAFMLPPVFPDNVIVTMLQNDLAIVLIIAFILNHCGLTVSALPILRLAPSEFFIAIAAGLLLTTVSYGLILITEGIFGESEIIPAEFLEKLQPTNIGQMIVLGTEILIIGVILEEVIFRMIIFSGFRERGFWAAAVVSSLLYALIHIDPVSILPMFIVGMVMCWLYERSRNLAVPMLAHLVANIALLMDLSGVINFQ